MQFSFALTPKQRRFVEEYLIDLNATQAAIRAGYSPKTAHSAGPRLLENVDVARAIDAGIDARSARVLVEADRVLKELGRIAFLDPRGFFNEKGALKQPHELTEEQAAALASIETAEVFDGRGSERVLVGYARKLKFWDKIGALELAMRHLGLLKERVEHSGEMKITREIVHVTRSEVPTLNDTD